MLLFNAFLSFFASTRSTISIHLMLLFNRTWTIWQITDWYFNTSNVTIQPPYCPLSSSGNTYFNTSNVTIQLQTLNTSSTNINNFNTSNVTIQPTYEWCSNACYIISIHLMLLFNLIYMCSPSASWKFQYI